MAYTTDRNDPDLGFGGNTNPVAQNKKYLVLSEEERVKGFIRPVRKSYIHVGKEGPKYELVDLSIEDKERFKSYEYIKFEKYPEEGNCIGRYWSQKDLDEVNNGCKSVTTMGLPLAETYARDPNFYGFTYCVHCSKHLPVDEFTWEDGSRVGS